ncbi:SpoIIE family protein phosphatase [Duganella phyllosphaerae]|uniref:Serine/threonine-protein kinase RsbT n=1 Tax=Duganella phyllosphaerae TaxID=762836 RepID=A0A1E7WF08_9BURK|nr:SpoIIE family protein phosphatase [Duganella phyllosphaerae]OEZ96898.1 serine/threonine-protein kinase RsbT [Duganella phyllosphaerae]
MEKINQSVESSTWITITHASDIAAARRAGQRLADTARFDDVRAGQLALLITEAATNILKHAGDGVIVLSAVHAGEMDGIDVLAYDAGPGIGNMAQALRDGNSSAGTSGTGLGALHRLSDQFDVYAPRDKGAVFFMRLWRTPSPELHLASGGISLPLAGETANGDAWAVVNLRQHTALLMVDGLGHGPEAAKAAAAAIATLALQPGLRPAEQVQVCHEALRNTRGAALALGLLDPAAGQLHFTGIGNISACVIDAAGRRQLASYNGIVGHNMRKVQEFTVNCAPGALVILATDGIGTQWDLDQYPGLAGCDPSVVAAVLLRDYARPRDDASVLVYRVPEPA